MGIWSYEPTTGDVTLYFLILKTIVERPETVMKKPGGFKPNGLLISNT